MNQTAQRVAATRSDSDDQAPTLRLRSKAEEDREPAMESPAELVDEDMMVVQMSAKAAAHGLESKEDREHRQEVQRLGE